MDTNMDSGSPAVVKLQCAKPKENGFLQPTEVQIPDGQCPHGAISHQCPSPKKGLAHAIVQCNIHLGRIADPRILPCGHSFCYLCLRVLYEEQKPGSSGGQNRPSAPAVNGVSTTTILTCPLCRRENSLDSIESLTINYAISDLLEIFDAEEKEEERIRRETMSEMEHTIGILKSLGQKLEKKLVEESTDGVYAGCLRDAIHATEKRLSYLEHLAGDIDDEKDHARRERLLRNLHYTCLAYQRLAEMTDGEMQLFSNSTITPTCLREIEDFLQMYKSAIVLEYRPTDTMGERRSRVWFTIVFSLLIQRCWSHLENRRFRDAARHLSLEFSNTFDESDGAWIVVVGRRPLGCWIWKDEHDYACLDIADYRLVVYRRNLPVRSSTPRSTPTKQTSTPPSRDETKSAAASAVSAANSKLAQSHLEQILSEAVQLKEKGGWQDLNISKFIRERLQRELDGFYWHTAAGYSGEFAVYASSTKDEEIDLEPRASESGRWKALVWEG